MMLWLRMLSINNENYPKYMEDATDELARQFKLEGLRIQYQLEQEKNTNEIKE